MTAVETSAVTWGGTELSYTIRRSPRRKKTVAVTVDPTGGILVVAPERVATERLDSIVGRKAEWIVRRIRRAGAHGALLSPREFVSGESVLYLGRHYRLKVNPLGQGVRSCGAGGFRCPRAGEVEARRKFVPRSSRGSAGGRRSGYRNGSRRGMRRPASRCHTSSWPASRSAGAVATRPGPSA